MKPAGQQPKARKHKGKGSRKDCGGKRRYRDHDEAVRALRNIGSSTWQGRDGKKPGRAYFCGRCKGFHLTSKPS